MEAKSGSNQISLFNGSYKVDMPEYFDISLICRKTSVSRSEIENCLKQFGLSEGECKTNLFSDRQIIIDIIDGGDTDYDELSIGLPEQVFHRQIFENELKEITDFVSRFFECNYNFEYGLCSYELNGYLLSLVNKFDDFSSNELLEKFPVVYKKEKYSSSFVLGINMAAQNLFV